MKEHVMATVRGLQDSMVESARPCFGESELDDLRSIIRLTVEFDGYLHFGHPELRKRLEVSIRDYGNNIPIDVEQEELRYAIQSICSGIDSFTRVSAAYRTMADSISSDIKWDAVSKASLKGQFISFYKDFIAEAVFEKKCRHLLDLFKIQIVFAGVLFE